MNTKHLSVAILTSLFMLAACEDKSAIEKAEDKVNDALDRRPNEQIRDAAEDLSDAAKDVGSAVNDAAKDVAHDAKSVASDVAEDAKHAAHELKDSTR
jgi:hypothetical protein